MKTGSALSGGCSPGFTVCDCSPALPHSSLFGNTDDVNTNSTRRSLGSSGVSGAGESRRPRWWRWGLLGGVAVAAAVVIVVVLLQGRPGPRRHVTTTAQGEVVQTNRTWHCRGAVHLRLVRVTMTNGKKGDAVHLDRGCTGVIQRLEIPGNGSNLGPSSDGVKVHTGAHDLKILSGVINCGQKKPGNHQDAIQAMGGMRVTLYHIESRGCANSFMFINWGRSRHQKPEDIVCEQCHAETNNYSISVRNSVRSGAIGGSFVSRVPPRATANATSPVLQHNGWQPRSGVSG